MSYSESGQIQILAKGFDLTTIPNVEINVGGDISLDESECIDALLTFSNSVALTNESGIATFNYVIYNLSDIDDHCTLGYHSYISGEDFVDTQVESLIEVNVLNLLDFESISSIDLDVQDTFTYNDLSYYEESINDPIIINATVINNA